MCVYIFKLRFELNVQHELILFFRISNGGIADIFTVFAKVGSKTRLLLYYRMSSALSSQ